MVNGQTCGSDVEFNLLAILFRKQMCDASTAEKRKTCYFLGVKTRDLD